MRNQSNLNLWGEASLFVLWIKSHGEYSSTLFLSVRFLRYKVVQFFSCFRESGEKEGEVSLFVLENEKNVIRKRRGEC